MTAERNRQRKRQKRKVKPTLELACLNCNGLSTKTNQNCTRGTNVEAWVEETDADVTVLIETKLSSR